MLHLGSTGEAIDWITSDHHFGHANISAFCGRGYDDDLPGMNTMLIDAWNATVSPTDTVVHLGDIALGKRVETLKVISQLHGRILFMPGNHDGISLLMTKACQARELPAYQDAFAALLDERGDHLTTSAGNTAKLSHYPYRDAYATTKMAKLFHSDEGGLLVHGHTHSPHIYGERTFHVGVDAHDFQPVAASTIESWIDTHSA